MCLGLWAWRWFGASAATTTQHTTPGKSLKHNITTYPHHSNTRRIPGSFSRNYIFLIISSCLSRMTDSRHKSYESTKSLETSGKLLGPDFQLVAWSSNSHSHHPTSWPQPWGRWPSSHHLAPSTPCKRLRASCWSSLLEKGTEGSTVLPRSFSCPSRCCSKRELSDLASPMQRSKYWAPGSLAFNCSRKSKAFCNSCSQGSCFFFLSEITSSQGPITIHKDLQNPNWLTLTQASDIVHSR